jgi:alpha-D-ribose 1-methylphosphonate 5-triphosphate synthase subunit PhnH
MTDLTAAKPAFGSLNEPVNIPNPGFADPTRESQTAFRAIMDALAHPTRSYPLAGPAQPPAALGRGLGAVALTLLDEDVAVWLGGPLADDAEVAAWLDFHTGARRVDSAAEADFVFVTPGEAPALDTLRLGTDEAPHLTATVVLDVRGIACGSPREAHHFIASGPGIDGSAELDVPWTEHLAEFVGQWRVNGAGFPRGVDLLLVTEDEVSALPRTTKLAPVSIRAARESISGGGVAAEESVSSSENEEA